MIEMRNCITATAEAEENHPSQGEEITRSLSSGNRKDPRETRKKIKTKAQKTRRRIIAMIIAECLTLTAIFGYAFFARRLTMMPRPDVDKTYVKNDDLQVEDLEKMKGYWMSRCSVWIAVMAV